MEVKRYIENTDRSSYKIAQSDKYAGDDYWNWSVWIEASSTDLDKIEWVTYNLHPTFPEPIKNIRTRENNFKLEASGWGTFTIYARLNFKDKSVMDLEHELELHYDKPGTDTPSKDEPPAKDKKPEKKPRKR